MNRVSNFISDMFQALDTPGGHMCICLGLLLYYGNRGANAPLAHDIAIFALGVLSRSMGSRTERRGAMVTYKDVGVDRSTNTTLLESKVGDTNKDTQSKD